MKQTKLKYKVRRFSKKSKVFFSSIFIFIILIYLIFLTISHRYDHIQKTEVNSRQDFITAIKPGAMELNRKYHVPASIIMAQASLESNFGQSKLAANYHNLFGVKAGLLEPKIKLPTKEFVNGQWIVVNDNFKVYKNWQQSLEDHTKLLVNGTSWNHNQYAKVIQAKNYVDAANALQQAGYATDPNYAQKLILMIEEYKLYQYDLY